MFPLLFRRLVWTKRLGVSRSWDIGNSSGSISSSLYIVSLIVITCVFGVCPSLGVMAKIGDLEIQKLVEIGSSFGLEGSDLQTFVMNESDKCKLRRDEERQRRSEDRELLQLQIDLESLKKENATSGNSGDAHRTVTQKAKPPKLPCFSESDDLDAYLDRFERYAGAQKWERQDWAINLSSLLTGKALFTYGTLPSSEANDYDRLKLALLRRYNLTPDGYKIKFRSSKPDKNETATQFVSKLCKYFDRWIDTSKVKHEYDTLREHLVLDQLYQAIPTELAIFIKERKPKNLSDASKLADGYLDVHKGWGRMRNPFSNVVDYRPKTEAVKQPPRNQSSVPRKTAVCYYCRKPGHFWKRCRLAPKSFVPTMAMLVDIVRTSCELDEVDQPDIDGVEGDGRDEPSSEAETPTMISFARVDRPTDEVLVNDRLELKCGYTIPIVSAVSKLVETNMPVAVGFIGDVKVQVLRDTGCNGVVVKRALVSPDMLTGEFVPCVLADQTIRYVPVASVPIDSSYYVGTVSAACVDNPTCDVLIGNIPGACLPWQPDPKWEPQNSKCDPPEIVGAVQTRSQAKEKPFKPLKVKEPMPDIVDADELKKQQQSDPSLSKVREKIGQIVKHKSGSSATFVMRNGILCREFSNPGKPGDATIRQVVVPTKLRQSVMSIAHESLLGGHLGTQKTVDRILSNFFWPALQADVRRFCRSCDLCQRTTPKGKVSRVPLGSSPIIDVPFQRVAADIVGPIFPSSERGHRYILVLVDYATRYPEAAPMKSIESEKVAEELLNIFSRVGFPHEILTDQGPQFISNVMKEVGRLLSIDQLTTTPYNPRCNGLVERFNATLKSMLRKMCDERPKDWDRYIDPLLFAYRETPQGSTKFSPFELLYGRTVRGPMQILKELWTNETEETETRNTYQYVMDLKQRLSETCRLARKELQKSQAKYKSYYDRKTKLRKLVVGDEVLLLLPTDQNKLLMQWKGPYVVSKVVNEVDYTIDMGHVQKTYHINMLKKYFRSTSQVVGNSPIYVSELLELTEAPVINEDVVTLDHECNLASKNDMIGLPIVTPKEKVTDVHVNTNLSEGQIHKIEQLIFSYPDVFTDLPGKTNLGEHDIKLIDEEPVRKKAYPAPHGLRHEIQTELGQMLEIGVIEHSDSPYASPLVIVKKSDGTNRYCVDYRALNAKTIFDAEPIPDISEIFTKLAKDCFFTKLDLSKGYWQIPVKDEVKPLTAFITHHGLYQFNTMPFGLINSAATFSRVMRKLLKGIPNVDNYIDDILVHTATFEDHLTALEEILKRLREHNLTAKPSKCCVGYGEVEFLGHIVCKGKISPRPEKLEAIKDAPRPQTKSQLRSFLGLAGYYRSFIPNYAEVAIPLTDKLKKGEPNKIRWEEAQERSFRSLKHKLCDSPILHLPDLEKQFILRTDASDVGMAAVLLQESEEVKFPVAYASKKFTNAQKNYSVIERECYAIVWAVEKFEPYLYGTNFVIETDHKPLKCIQKSKVANGRIMRWALILQHYRYHIRVIKGRDNIGADFLSRAIA